MIVVGVDPGKTGAIAAVAGERLLWIMDMPTAAGQIAPALLGQLYDPAHYGPWHLSREPWAAAPVAIEHVHSMPKQGLASTFAFGRSYGVMLGWFTARGHRITHVAPTTWKTTFHLNGKDKDAARLLALELWPQQAQLFARKLDIGRADAALIALHHARTTHRTEQTA